MGNGRRRPKRYSPAAAFIPSRKVNAVPATTQWERRKTRGRGTRCSRPIPRPEKNHQRGGENEHHKSRGHRDIESHHEDGLPFDIGAPQQFVDVLNWYLLFGEDVPSRRAPQRDVREKEKQRACEGDPLSAIEEQWRVRELYFKFELITQHAMHAKKFPRGGGHRSKQRLSGGVAAAGAWLRVQFV